MNQRAAWVLVCALLLSLFPSPQHALAVAAPQVSVSPLQFSPNGDGDRDSTTISVKLSTAAQERVRILNSEGTVVGIIHDYWDRQAGTFRYRFNGTVRNPSGDTIRLTEGTYYAEATTRGDDGSTASDRARFYINNTIKNVSVRSTRLSYNAYHSLFSPNGDSRKDGLAARFYLIRPATVILRINTGGKEVRTLQQTFTASGNKILVWDGRIRNSSGTLVWAPAGRYYVRVQALPTNQAKADRIGYAYADRTVVADKSRPSVGASLSRSSFTPSYGESTVFRYTLGESGYRRITVVNSSGTVVRSITWGATSTSGSYTWNGKNSSGNVVAAGTYYIRMHAQDRAGNAATYYPISRSVSVKAASASPTSGHSAKIPWSGYWWPQLSSYQTKLYNNPGPMTKYDAVTGASSYSWEYNNHRTTDPANDWWGHCQAWASAAIMEPQPYGRTVSGVTFSQDDVEGLYSEVWWGHDMDFWGTRYSNQGTGSEAYKDVYPAVFDRVVRYWIGEQKVALEMDLTTGTPVWNYPVYAFSRSSTWSGGKEYVTMTITRAAPYLGVNGTTPIKQTFYYTLQSGTNGVWYNPQGSSVNTHPDYVARIKGILPGGNPRVERSVLNDLFR